MYKGVGVESQKTNLCTPRIKFFIGHMTRGRIRSPGERKLIPGKYIFLISWYGLVLGSSLHSFFQSLKKFNHLATNYKVIAAQVHLVAKYDRALVTL